MKARFLVPLGVFGALVVLFAVGLGLDPRMVPSPLINKPAPKFNLPTLDNPQKMLSRGDLTGKVTLFNVWASWCTACREEQTMLMEIAHQGEVPIYGLNYKDTRPAAHDWLNRFGDPYVANAFDAKGLVGINWGVYGVPETFLVDKKGVIRYKQIGPITPEAWTKTLLPMIRRLKAEQG